MNTGCRSESSLPLRWVASLPNWCRQSRKKVNRRDSSLQQIVDHDTCHGKAENTREIGNAAENYPAVFAGKLLFILVGTDAVPLAAGIFHCRFPVLFGRENNLYSRFYPLFFQKLPD